MNEVSAGLIVPVFPHLIVVVSLLFRWRRHQSHCRLETTGSWFGLVVSVASSSYDGAFSTFAAEGGVSRVDILQSLNKCPVSWY